jgi:hypothetical protein
MVVRLASHTAFVLRTHEGRVKADDVCRGDGACAGATDGHFTVTTDDAHRLRGAGTVNEALVFHKGDDLAEALFEQSGDAQRRGFEQPQRLVVEGRESVDAQRDLQERGARIGDGVAFSHPVAERPTEEVGGVAGLVPGRDLGRVGCHRNDGRARPDDGVLHGDPEDVGLELVGDEVAACGGRSGLSHLDRRAVQGVELAGNVTRHDLAAEVGKVLEGTLGRVACGRTARIRHHGLFDGLFDLGSHLRHELVYARDVGQALVHGLAQLHDLLVGDVVAPADFFHQELNGVLLRHGYASLSGHWTV